MLCHILLIYILSLFISEYLLYILSNHYIYIIFTSRVAPDPRALLVCADPLDPKASRERVARLALRDRLGAPGCLDLQAQRAARARLEDPACLDLLEVLETGDPREISRK